MTLTNENTIIHHLNACKAFVAAPVDAPFWYTSGTLGPYFVNTHFLLNGRLSAETLLSGIDGHKEDPERCIQYVDAFVQKENKMGTRYHDVCNLLVARLKDLIDVHEITMISGGERRDWFFSVAIAHLLNKPHLWLFKNGTARLQQSKNAISTLLEPNSQTLEGQRIVHIVDLITAASSYTRAWLPFIENRGGRCKHTLTVVDRDQGGRLVLEQLKVSMQAQLTLDKSFFATLKNSDMISSDQYLFITQFTTDPIGTMRQFLLKNPQFMRDALAGKQNSTLEKAQRCQQEDPYNLGRPWFNNL